MAATEWEGKCPRCGRQYRLQLHPAKPQLTNDYPILDCPELSCAGRIEFRPRIVHRPPEV